MHEDTLAFFRGTLNELKDILCCLVILVEEYLALNVLPEESKIDDTEAFPLILDLLAGAVDDPRHLVHLNKV